MAYWLLKSEPAKYSWDQMVKDGRTHWDGVRNFQAANNMKAMQQGDRAFFYHSNEGKEIVGIVEIVREHYPDPTDKTGKFVCVDIKADKPLKKPVTLVAVKAEKALADMDLLKQSRLSVGSVTPDEWKLICRMGGI